MMAVAGGAKPCVSMQIVDGNLVIGPQEMTTVAVTDVDLAVQRLVCGEKVYVALYGGLPLRVERTVRMSLGQDISGVQG